MGLCVYKKRYLEPDGSGVDYELKFSEKSGFDLIVTKGELQITHHFNSFAEYNNLMDTLSEFGFAIESEMRGFPMVDYLTDEEYEKL